MYIVPTNPFARWRSGVWWWCQDVCPISSTIILRGEEAGWQPLALFGGWRQGRETPKFRRQYQGCYQLLFRKRSLLTRWANVPGHLTCVSQLLYRLDELTGARRKRWFGEWVRFVHAVVEIDKTWVWGFSCGIRWVEGGFGGPILVGCCFARHPWSGGLGFDIRFTGRMGSFLFNNTSYFRNIGTLAWNKYNEVNIYIIYSMSIKWEKLHSYHMNITLSVESVSIWCNNYFIIL